MKRSFVRLLAAAAAAFAATCAWAQAPVKVGIVTFLSGPAAGPFGVPARNAAEIMAETVNAGRVPGAYATKGFGGSAMELVIIDEAGGPQKQVQELRNLAQRVDLVIGYISSGDCLAVAPVAEELKKLTVLFDCGTPRIFEDASYRYVFRTGATATGDAVALARYVLDRRPGVKSFAGINQNYAWGQDSWTDFEAAMKALKPDVEVKTSQMPKLFAGQFGAEISTLLSSNAEVIHSSFWGGDLEGLVLQGAPRGPLPEAPGAPRRRRAGDQPPRLADPRRHDHRRARALRSVLAGHRARQVVPDRVPGALRRAAELRRVQDGAGDPRREGGVREGAEGGRRDPEPGADHRARWRTSRSRRPAGRSAWRSARGTRRCRASPTAW